MELIHHCKTFLILISVISSNQFSKESVDQFDVQLLNVCFKAFKCFHHASAQQFISCIFGQHVAM